MSRKVRKARKVFFIKYLDLAFLGAPDCRLLAGRQGRQVCVKFHLSEWIQI